MTRVKNRHVSPVNGWKFFQPQTGAHFEAWDLESIANAVQSHRRANPRFKLSTDLNTIKDEIDESNALRMLSIPGADVYVDTTTSDSPKFRAPQPPSSPNAAVVSSMVGGAKILLEMFGEKGPVDAPLATQRASVCATCPKNDQGDWTRFFTIPASNMVRKMLGIINDMKLTTAYDDKLIFCTACNCPLKTKVWAPLDHIKKHTPGESMAALDPRCWILKEQ